MAESDGTQCGFCTPGIVMTAWAHAREGGEVHEALAGNLCRCTGYRPILDVFAGLSDDGSATPAPPPAESTRFEAPGQVFFLPASLPGLLALRAAHPRAWLLAGGTDLGLRVSDHREAPTEVLCLLNVPELSAMASAPAALTVGAAVPYRRLLDLFRREAGFAPFGELLARLGSRQIRGLGTLGGNLGTASPIGDALPPLVALGAEVRVASVRGRARCGGGLPDRYRPTRSRRTRWSSRSLPRPGRMLAAARRSASARPGHRDRRAALCCGCGGGGGEARLPSAASRAPWSARRARSRALGRPFDAARVAAAAAALAGDSSAALGLRGSAAYRLAVAQGLLRRLHLRAALRTVRMTWPPSQRRCDMDGSHGLPRKGAGAALRHDSALKHTTGEARFADDLPEAPGTLHAALVLSTVPHGRLLSLDDAAARAMPGVVAVIGPRDIAGENNIAPATGVEPLFADPVVEFAGMPLAMVVARSRDEAIRAAAAIKPAIEPLEPVLSIERALEMNQHVVPPMTLAPRRRAAASHRRRRAAPPLGRVPRRRTGAFLPGRPGRRWRRRRGRGSRDVSPPTPAPRRRCQHLGRPRCWAATSKPASPSTCRRRGRRIRLQGEQREWVRRRRRRRRARQPAGRQAGPVARAT
jgi:xanthine dehydrogenase small subunit